MGREEARKPAGDSTHSLRLMRSRSMGTTAAISISLTAAVSCPWGACGQEVLGGGKQPRVLALRNMEVRAGV